MTYLFVRGQRLTEEDDCIKKSWGGVRVRTGRMDEKREKGEISITLLTIKHIF